MRTLLVTAAAMAMLLYGAAPALAQHSAPSPFPVQRGTAPPPPQPRAPTQAAPPQGVAAGGVDFGQWRSAEATAYDAAFRTQIAARLGGKDAPAVQADLQANGFACEQGTRLDCRIEITEGGCLLDWYVVVDEAGVHPGYEKTCTGAQPS